MSRNDSEDKTEDKSIIIHENHFTEDGSKCKWKPPEKKPSFNPNVRSDPIPIPPRKSPSGTFGYGFGSDGKGKGY